MDRIDFVQDAIRGTPEYEAVLAIADALYEYLARAEVQASILAANRPGRSSADVQTVFLDHAVALGFTSESRGLFADYLSALRPDYYLPLGDTGIILEVERGKTTINNMDLLDFWKCHILPSGSLPHSAGTDRTAPERDDEREK